MWSVVMAGGYANWYVSTTAWDVLVPGDVTPGYSYCRHLIAFFTSAEYWLLENNDAMLILPQESNADGCAKTPACLATFKLFMCLSQCQACLGKSSFSIHDISQARLAVSACMVQMGDGKSRRH
jgi:hypothetical protein